MITRKMLCLAGKELIEKSISLLSGFIMSRHAASGVDSITDYNGFYCILLLASGVDTVFNVVGEEESHGKNV